MCNLIQTKIDTCVIDKEFVRLIHCYFFQAWVDAGKLMFVSLGLGTGSITSLAGYTHFHSHCFR